ncbi:hypothetical protein VN24_02150 [Paenibacillus beijingensis]|uniref:EfeO-type cupredoxin-like domain-containing protein n=1 Tax=Paenibacillus beijingensis TaxID=1126833 RepID=A0A0D5NQY8_9BACL|nr:hypothetical protein VN24_02150 [Paenibacillus beijingensis]
MTACGSSGKQSGADNSSSGATDTATASQELVVHAKNWEFDKKEYTVKKGEPLKISLESQNVHGIEIANTDVKLEPGESTVITIDNAGDYEISCYIPCGTGHHEMKATLKVV